MAPQTSQQFIYCPYTGIKLSGVAARNCNYCDLETYICSHSGEPCVVKEGLEQFAQFLAESAQSIPPDAFQKAKEKVEQEKRETAIANIIRLVEPKYLSETEKRNLSNARLSHPKE